MNIFRIFRFRILPRIKNGACQHGLWSNYQNRLLKTKRDEWNDEENHKTAPAGFEPAPLLCQGERSNHWAREPCCHRVWAQIQIHAGSALRSQRSWNGRCRAALVRPLWHDKHVRWQLFAGHQQLVSGDDMNIFFRIFLDSEFYPD